MLSFKISGMGSVDKDYKAFNTSVFHGIHAGLVSIGSELTKQLQQHIRTDVYNAYSPKSYPRRSNHPQFGTPLESTDNMDLQIGKLSLAFNYEPSGSHSGKNRDRIDWSELSDDLKKSPDKPIKPNPVHGDDLIRRIETGTGYDWDVEVPERHFWNNFVEEAIGEHGWTEKLLVKTMNETEKKLQAVADGRIVRDGNDTVFEQQMSFMGSDNSDEDDELPY